MSRILEIIPCYLANRELIDLEKFIFIEIFVIVSGSWETKRKSRKFVTDVIVVYISVSY